MTIETYIEALQQYAREYPNHPVTEITMREAHRLLFVNEIEIEVRHALTTHQTKES